VKKKKIFLVLGIGFLMLGGKIRENRIPLFFEMSYDTDMAYQAESIGQYNEEELMEPFDFHLVKGEGQPTYYTSKIRTTVCDDEVCEIMHIQLFWDLVGKYVGYDTVPGYALTKFDHEPFLSEDYEKLHGLLSNEGSILKFKSKEELIDKEKVQASDVVDGTTGATSLEIRQEVVKGALYTSYTIWHIVYKGAIKNLLTAHTNAIYNDRLKDKFLKSNRNEYALFALRKFTEEDFQQQKPFLMKSMKEGIPLLRKFILNDLPEKLWENENLQTEICGMFPFLDVNSKTHLINKLKVSKTIHPKSLELLSAEIMAMNKNQLINYLTVIKEQEDLDERTMANIRMTAQDDSFRYAYLISEHLGSGMDPPG
jgi:hypothetical protein